MLRSKLGHKSCSCLTEHGRHKGPVDGTAVLGPPSCPFLPPGYSVSERRTPVGRGHYAIRAPGASGPCLSRYQTRAVNLISMSCVGRARRDVVTIVLATAGRSDP
jgi:hypothetical protein